MTRVRMFPEPCIFIIGGLPGSGKAEQGELLSKFLFRYNSKLSVMRYDNGNGLREAARSPDFMDHMKNILSKSINTIGETVPGAMTINRWTQFLLEQNDGKSHFILEGMFRTSYEPDLFVEFTDKYLPGVPRCFIRLNVSDDVIWKRIGGEGRVDRTDDNAKTIKNRIKVYQESTESIYDTIRGNPNFIFLDIDAEPSIEKVHAEIKREITEHIVLSQI